MKVIGEEGESIKGVSLQIVLLYKFYTTIQVRKDWIVTYEDQDILSVKCPQQYETTPIEDFVVWTDPLDATNEFVCVRYTFAF